MRVTLPLASHKLIFFCFFILSTVDVFSQPTISSFSPSSGPVGTVVTISGTNFNTTSTANIVYFGAVPVNVSSASATSLSVTVPSGTSYEPITVTTNGLTAYSSKPFITTFSVTDPTFTPVSFASRVSSPANPNAFDISMHDLDGDGKADVIVVNREDGNFSVSRNTSVNGTISFAPKIDFTTNSGPYAVAVGDLNGDGKPDLAFPNSGSANVSVFINTSTSGNISFAPKTDFTVGANPQGIAIGDLDVDGKPEMIVTTNVGTAVSVFPNTSTGGTLSFGAKTDYALPVSTLNSYSVSLGDLNGDNKPEIITANVFTNNISVFRNISTSGAIVMGSRIDYATGYSPQSVCISDLDGDGKPDLAAGGNQTINVLRNVGSAGAITFNAAQALMPTGGHRITVSDFNGDGKPDIGSARGTFDAFSILRNTSTVGVISFSYDGDYSAGIAPISPFAADVDGDGKPDVVFPNYSASTFSVLRNRINEPNIVSFQVAGGCSTAGSSITLNGSNFTGATAVSFGGTPATSFTVNSDNSITAIATTTITGTISVTTAMGTGTMNYPSPTINSFTSATASPGASIIIKGNYFCGATAVSIGGVAASSFVINSDTSITAVVASIASGNVVVTTPVGAASLAGFYNGPVISSFSPASGPAGTTVTITGTNFDPTAGNNIIFFGANQADVVSGNGNSLTVVSPVGGTYELISVTASNFTAYSNQPFVTTFTGGDTLSVASFAGKVDFAAATNPSDVATADFDGDGKDDLAVANRQSNSVSVFKNTAISGSITSTSLATKVDLTTGTHPSNVATGDINGDGKPDLIVCSNGTSNVSVFKNTSASGTLSFAAKTDFSAGSQPTGVVIGDLDNDGKPDLIFSSDSSYTFHILRNTGSNGNVAFAVAGDFYYVGDISYGIALADLNGDNKPDIVLTEPDLSSVIVFRNTSTRGNISFASSGIEFATGAGPYRLSIGDLDGDNKPDLAVANKNSNSVSLLRNTSAGGTISFAPKQDIATGTNPVSVAMDDLDGDGKPDLAVTNQQSATVSLFRNKSSIGTLAFGNKKDFTTGSQPSGVAIADLDGDGKVDLAICNQQDNSLSILRNKTGEPQPLALCAAGNVTITSNLSGAGYQWQVNAGSGFTNLSDNSNYTGSHSVNLQLNNIPSAWYGYQYRCVVDGNNSNLFSLKFENVWTGAVSTAWEDPLNWSCGTVPDVNTDVIINSGTVAVSTSTTIRSLTLSPGVNLVINTGVTLTITH